MSPEPIANRAGSRRIEDAMSPHTEYPFDIPEESTFNFTVKRTPAGAVWTFTCPTCSAKLGSFIVGNAKSKLPAGWWRCPNGCNADIDRLDA
jgi:hypothetical protein